MAYSTDVVLERMLVRLGNPTVTPSDLVIYEDVITSSEDFVSLITRYAKASFPDTLMSIVLQMSLELYNHVKSEGYQNETVEGITIRYQDIFEKYKEPLKHYRRLVML